VGRGGGRVEEGSSTGTVTGTGGVGVGLWAVGGLMVVVGSEAVVVA
jgi:hypothetical protein